MLQTAADQKGTDFQSFLQFVDAQSLQACAQGDIVQNFLCDALHLALLGSCGVNLLVLLQLCNQIDNTMFFNGLTHFANQFGTKNDSTR